jgi:hypothetical protein
MDAGLADAPSARSATASEEEEAGPKVAAWFKGVKARQAATRPCFTCRRSSAGLEKLGSCGKIRPSCVGSYSETDRRCARVPGRRARVSVMGRSPSDGDVPTSDDTGRTTN